MYRGKKTSFKLNTLNQLKLLKYQLSNQNKTIIFIRKDGLDKFEQKEISKNLDQLIIYKEAIITNSLYSSAVNVGIEPNVIIEFARIYGFQIDFQETFGK